MRIAQQWLLPMRTQLLPATRVQQAQPSLSRTVASHMRLRNPQEKERQLRQISRDFEAQGVRAAELLIDGSALGFLAADAGGALRLLRYDNTAAHARATLRGQRLLNLCVLPDCDVLAYWSAWQGCPGSVCCSDTCDGPFLTTASFQMVWSAPSAVPAVPGRPPALLGTPVSDAGPRPAGATCTRAAACRRPRGCTSALGRRRGGRAACWRRPTAAWAPSRPW
jgi:hypothetical protein